MSLPSKFHIAWQNDLINYVLTSTVAAEAEFPLTNSQTKVRGEITKFDMTGITEVSIQWSSAAEYTANCFCIDDHNMLQDNSARLRLFPDEAQAGVEVADVTKESYEAIPWASAMPGINQYHGYYEPESNLKKSVKFAFDTCQYKSGQLDFTCPTSNTDELWFSKMYLAFAYSPEFNFDWSNPATVVDPSQHFRQYKAGLHTRDLDAHRRLAFDFSHCTDRDRDVLGYILDTAKKGGDLLVFSNPNAVGREAYEGSGIFKRMNDTSFEAIYSGAHGLSLLLEEN
jgi:hypothetical protein